MSWDIWLEVDTGGPEPATIAHEPLNYTYNVSPMYRLAGLGTPSEWDGKPADEVYRITTVVAKTMVERWDECVALNPENGWGDAGGALDFILHVRRVCADHPRATVRVG